MKKKSAINQDRVIIYARVSTDKKTQELGLEAQVQECRRWCAFHGKEEVGLFQEEISGATDLDERVQMLLALEALTERKAGILLAQKIDRFSRDQNEAQRIVQRVRNARATLVSVQSGAMGDPVNDLMFNILMSFGQFELEQIRSRIVNAFAIKKQRKEYLGGHVPFGKRIHEEVRSVGPNGSVEITKLLVDDDDEQQALKKLREWRSQGLSWARLSEKAYSHGITFRKGTPMDATWLRKNLDMVLDPPPFGFQWSPLNELVPNEHEQAIQGWIVEAIQKGMPLETIVENLGAAGFKARNGKPPTLWWLRQRLEEIRSAQQATKEVARPAEEEASPGEVQIGATLGHP